MFDYAKMDVNDIIFLSELAKKLNAKGNVNVSNNVVKLDWTTDQENKLQAVFDLELCKRFNNHINRFINEIL